MYAEEQGDEDRPRHMQRGDVKQVERRSDVAIKISAGAETLLEENYSPKGIFRRGYSSGLINIPLDPGSHTVNVQIGDVTENGVEWQQSDEKTLEIKKGERIVLKFDEQDGFHWYF